jgi:phage portal protein BeeE|tara:strand:+ start:1154 stop:2755 length:1602 start_codon:yes stop_codon:yes gene_type:complete
MVVDVKPQAVVDLTQSKVNQLLARYRKAKGIKDQWIPIFEDCYEYALPQRESFYSESIAKRRSERIFDETAVVGVQEFASRLQSGIVPNYARWADFVSGSEIPKGEQKEINETLDSVTEYVFEILQNSNFSQEVHETFLDCAVGTGVLLVEEGDAVQPVKFRSIPLPHVLLDAGHDDKIDHIFRERFVKYKQLLIAFPNAIIPERMKEDMMKNPDKDCKIIEAVYRNYDNTKEEEYTYCVISEMYQAELLTKTFKGIGSNPFIVYRWSKCAGEVYGRGPLQLALPAIKTANLVIELILENAQMAISGMYQVEDDGVINVDNIQLIPGTIIPKAVGSTGLTPVQPAGNFQVSDLVLRDMRTNIKKALYNDMLGTPNEKTPMSATEVAERMADLSRQIGAAFGRLQAELVNPVLQRVVYILKKQGRIKIPVINGREIKIRSSSPLAQAQQQQDVATVDRFVSLLQARLGPQLANVLVKQNDLAKFIARKLGVPEELIRSDDEMQQAAMQIQQMMQAGQQAGLSGKDMLDAATRTG